MGLIKQYRHRLADWLESWGYRHGLVNPNIYISLDKIIYELDRTPIKKLPGKVDRFLRLAPSSFYHVYNNVEYWSQINLDNRLVIHEIIESKTN